MRKTSVSIGNVHIAKNPDAPLFVQRYSFEISFIQHTDYFIRKILIYLTSDDLGCKIIFRPKETP